jgi:sulfur carrier protein ThiS
MYYFNPKDDTMKITLPNGEIKNVDTESIVLESLLESLGISISEVLVILGSDVIPEDYVLGNEDEIRIIHVVFGG